MLTFVCVTDRGTIGRSVLGTLSLVRALLVLSVFERSWRACVRCVELESTGGGQSVDYSWDGEGTGTAGGSIVCWCGLAVFVGCTTCMIHSLRSAFRSTTIRWYSNRPGKVTL